MVAISGWIEVVRRERLWVLAAVRSRRLRVAARRYGQ